jgi:hypothetical protein
MTTATKNVIQGPGGPTDSGANRGASADVRMRAPQCTRYAARDTRQTSGRTGSEAARMLPYQARR